MFIKGCLSMVRTSFGVINRQLIPSSSRLCRRFAVMNIHECRGGPDAMRPPVPGPLPWLVFPCDGHIDDPVFGTISSPSSPSAPAWTFQHKSIPELCSKRIFASFHGWLLLLDHRFDKKERKASLWNPVTYESVELPPIDDLEYLNYYQSTIFTSSPKQPGCTVFLFHTRRPYVVYCKPGDAEWTRHDYGPDLAELFGEEYRKLPLMSRPACLNGLVYAHTYNAAHLVSVEVVGDGDRRFEIKNLGLTQPDSRYFTPSMSSYLLASFGDLYSIQMNLVGRDCCAQVAGIEVYKLDFSRRVWAEVERMDDRCFFLGNNCFTSCLASATKTQSNNIKANQIHFVMEMLDSDYEPGLYSYDMERRSILATSRPCAALQAPVWVMPDQRNDETEGEEQPKSSTFDLKGVSQYSSPLLVTYDDNGRIFRLTDPKGKETYAMTPPESFLGKFVVCSKDGYLLMVDHKSLCLLNPFTGEHSKLPELRCRPTSAAFSGSPSSDYCLVVDINPLGTGVWIKFIRPGEEKWKEVEFKTEIEFDPIGNSPIFYKGSFYIMSGKGDLGVFSLDKGDKPSWEILKGPCIDDDFARGYLTECNGELMAVFTGPFGEWVEVYKLDFAQKEWVDVPTLGNYMVFLSMTGSFSAIAKSPEMEDKVYFPRLNDGSIIYYSLDTDMFHTHGSDKELDDFEGTEEQLYCSWIEPPEGL